jgi:hypothetical protein
MMMSRAANQDAQGWLQLIREKAQPRIVRFESLKEAL